MDDLMMCVLSQPVNKIIEMMDTANADDKITIDKLMREITMTTQSIDNVATLRQIIDYFLVEHLLSFGALDPTEFGKSEYLMAMHSERSEVVASQYVTKIRQGFVKLGLSIAAYETYKKQKTKDSETPHISRPAILATTTQQLPACTNQSVHGPKFMRSRGKITRNVSHRYTHGKVFTSKAAYHQKTYCQTHGLPDLPQPDESVGLLDRRNHAFLVYPNDEINGIEYLGKRLTIEKLTDVQFALLAMQVASGRTTMKSPGDIDPAFEFLLSVVTGKTELIEVIPHPSCLKSQQQCEILFSFIYANVLTQVDPALRELCVVIQDFWFHGGARVSMTKQNGWAQNPRGLISDDVVSNV